MIVLANRADGVKGHYCIGRTVNGKYYEYYNKGKWCSAGQLFIGLESAIDALLLIINHKFKKLEELARVLQSDRESLHWSVKSSCGHEIEKILEE